MAPSRRRVEDLLARVNFPLYTVQMLGSRHVVVGGGGGSSKTGVANGFEIYEISNDGQRFVVEEILRHETGPCAVMNCSTYSGAKHSYIVATQDSYCQLYNVQNTIVEEKVETIGDTEVRHRKAKAENGVGQKKLTFVIKPADSVKTDFDEDEPLVRVVRINFKGNVMATGGTDGHVKLWKFPSLQFVGALKAHKKEIDDIDFNRFNNQLISVAKDATGIIWDYVTGKEIKRLEWTPPDGHPKYMYKRCRFGVIEGETEKSALYVLANPIGQSKLYKSYLQRWTSNGELVKVASVDESLSALAVRDDGRFVAVGTMFTGSVIVYATFSLQKIFTVSQAHSMFVTGLEFLPVAGDKHPVTSAAEFAVLSISVDNQLCIHSLPFRKSIPIWLGIIIIILVLFSTFLFCAYIGL